MKEVLELFHPESVFLHLVVGLVDLLLEIVNEVCGSLVLFLETSPMDLVSRVLAFGFVGLVLALFHLILGFVSEVLELGDLISGLFVSVPASLIHICESVLQGFGFLDQVLVLYSLLLCFLH